MQLFSATFILRILLELRFFKYIKVLIWEIMNISCWYLFNSSIYPRYNKINYSQYKKKYMFKKRIKIYSKLIFKYSFSKDSLHILGFKKL